MRVFTVLVFSQPFIRKQLSFLQAIIIFCFVSLFVLCFFVLFFFSLKITFIYLVTLVFNDIVAASNEVGDGISHQ